MITKVTKADLLNFSGRIVSGLFANPSSGNLAMDSYTRQQIITQILQDTINAFMSIGITIEEEEG